VQQWQSGRQLCSYPQDKARGGLPSKEAGISYLPPSGGERRLSAISCAPSIPNIPIALAIAQIHQDNDG